MNQRNKFRGLYVLNRQHKSPDSDPRGPQKTQKRPVINDDSLEQIAQGIPDAEKTKPKKEIKNHSRSHSCPFELNAGSERIPLGKLFHQRSPSAITEEHTAEVELAESSESGSRVIVNKKLARINSRGLPFAKKNSSQSSKSVVIHSNDANSVYLSSMLYSEKKIAEEEQRRPAIKKTSKRCVQKPQEDKFVVNRNKYLKMRLDQQIRKHQLNEDLQKVEKETNDISIKQMILEALLNKSGTDQKYLSGDTNESSIVFH